MVTTFTTTRTTAEVIVGPRPICQKRVLEPNKETGQEIHEGAKLLLHLSMDKP